MSGYHPRRHNREIKDSDEIKRLLKSGKYAVIAMAKENEPYIVTLSYGYDEVNKCLYFHCALKGQKIDFIKINPEICATIIEDYGYQKDQCEHAYSSLILRGDISIVKDLNEKKYGLEILLNHLEDNPAPIMKRNIKNDESYDKVTILRLKIADIVGKKYKDIDTNILRK